MLVLSRKEGERILIGAGIEVAIVSIAGNRVRIGVSAPIEVPVHRHELAQRLASEEFDVVPLSKQQESA